VARLGDIEIWRIEGELEEGDIGDPLYGEWIVIAVKGKPEHVFAVLHGSEGTEIEPVPLVEKYRLQESIRETTL